MTGPPGHRPHHSTKGYFFTSRAFMEKISLKPTAREINYRSVEPNTYHDIFEYAPRDEREKHLGYLYVIGQIKYGEENMAYVLNLIASLAKREYYSENDSPAEDPRQALDLTLKKLNGVLEDFFKNKDLKLNIGLVAIGHDQVYIAKLGKFKVFLARNNELIDILNNVVLFQKEHLEEKRFINIISGKIQGGDKIFALYPTRHTTLKEKELKSMLLKSDQEEFLAGLASWGQKSRNFQTCGFHIEIKKVKEETIPIRSAYEKSRAILTGFKEIEPITKESVISGERQDSHHSVKVRLNDKVGRISTQNQPSTLEKKAGQTTPAEIKIEIDPPKEENIAMVPEKDRDNSEKPLVPQTKAISAEMSLIRRGGAFGKIIKNLSWHSASDRWSSRLPIIIAAMALIGGGLFLAGRYWFGQNSHISGLLKTAEENIRLAEVQVAKNEPGSARHTLKASLVSLSSIADPNTKVSETKDKLISLLDRLDLVSVNQPKIFFDASQTPSSLTLTQIWSLDSGTLAALGKDQKIYKISNNSFWEMGTMVLVNNRYALQDAGYLVIYDGLDQLAVLETETGKSFSYSLPDPAPVHNATVYAGNLYLLSENSIYKYTDALAGKSKTKQTWLSGQAGQNPRALAVDGNVYVLTADGIITKYFKGAESGRYDLQLQFSDNISLLAPKDSLRLYLTDYPEKRIWVFDSQNGSLVASYKFAYLPEIKSVAIGNGFAFILDVEGKIWKIDLEF